MVSPGKLKFKAADKDFFLMELPSRRCLAARDPWKYPSEFACASSSLNPDGTEAAGRGGANPGGHQRRFTRNTMESSRRDSFLSRPWESGRIVALEENPQGWRVPGAIPTFLEQQGRHKP